MSTSQASMAQEGCDQPLLEPVSNGEPAAVGGTSVDGGPERLSVDEHGGQARIGRAIRRATSFVLPGASHSMPANVMRTNLAMAGTFATLQACSDQAVFDQVYQGFTTNGLLYAGSALAIGVATGQIKAPIGHIPEKLQAVGHQIAGGFKRIREGFDDWCTRPHPLNRTVAAIRDGISSFLPTQLSDPLQSVGASAMGVGAFFLLQGQATQNPIDVGLGAFNVALGAWNTFQSKQVARSVGEATRKAETSHSDLVDRRPVTTTMDDPRVPAFGI